MLEVYGTVETRLTGDEAPSGVDRSGERRGNTASIPAAGGVGVELFRGINSFARQSVAMVLIAILAVVILSEGISAYTRAKVR